MQSFQNFWISPEGEVIPVGTHEPYALAITGRSRNDPDSDLAFKKMFDRRWIRAIREGSFFYLNNSLNVPMQSLDKLPDRQKDGIIQFAQARGLELVNTHKNSINIDEEMTDSKEKDNPDLKVKFASLYAYLSRHLGITEPPKLVLTKNEENAKNPFGFTGYYDHETKTIRLYVTGRHDTDVLRSFAHEVIHHWQNLRGTLHPKGEER